MPANAVKPGEEAIWERAKKQAAKQGQGKNYAYIMDIFQKMKGKSMRKSAMMALPSSTRPSLATRVGSALGLKPSGSGWERIPGGVKGGYRKRLGSGKYTYWYPGMAEGGTERQAQEHQARREWQRHVKDADKWQEVAAKRRDAGRHPDDVRAAQRQMTEHAQAADKLARRYGFQLPLGRRLGLSKGESMNKSVRAIRDLCKAAANKPPAGFTPIAGSKKGGYHMKRGTGYIYWYPGQGITNAPHADDKGKAPTAAKPAAKPAPGKPEAKPEAKPAAKPEAKEAKPAAEAKPKGDLETLAGGREGKELISEVDKLPEGFNKMTKVERAILTADHDVVLKEMDERFGETKGYKGDLKAAINAHLDELGAHGWIIPSNVERAKKLMGKMAEHGEAAGIDKAKLATLMEENVRKLAHQEIEAAQRTLGDHGVRHLAVNAEQSDAIFDQLKKGGMDISPMDYFMANQVWLDHDMGYTIPAIARGGFAVKDNYHPQASTVMVFQQRDKYTDLFGKDGFDRYVQAVSNHSGSQVDWQKDYFGSAVRLADNTHLFADKMPEVLFDSKEAVETMVKIRLAIEAVPPTVEVEGKMKRTPEDKAKFKGLIAGIRGQLNKAIEARDDLPPESKAALLKAAREIGELTPKFLIGRLAGRSPKFDFDGKDMKVVIEQSQARETIGEVFGNDQADSQFTKLLKDYGVDPPSDAISEEPPPQAKARIGDEGNGVEFSWTAPSNEHHVERRHADIMKTAREEWKGIQKLEGEEKEAAMSKFFGAELAKALMELWALDDLLAKSDRLEKDHSAEQISKLASKVMGGAELDDVMAELGDDESSKKRLLAELRTRKAETSEKSEKGEGGMITKEELRARAQTRAKVRKARVGIGGALVENLDGDEAIAKSLEAADGLQLGVQPRHVGPRNLQMHKGTIYQGEAPDKPEAPEDMQRMVIAAQIVENDPAGFDGQGGLAQWWSDAWTGQPQNDHPLVTKSEAKPTQVIDDGHPEVRRHFLKRDY